VKTQTPSEEILTTSTSSARKDFAMDVDLLQLKRFRGALRNRESRADLVTCSLCLRVHRGSEWIEAEHVIRETRSFELDALPRLQSAICEVCAESIFSRRVAAAGQAKAA
jgi:hypothetical protein